MHDAIATLTPADQANLVAGKVVAYATAFLDGRDDAKELGRNARAAQIELMAGIDAPTAKPILDASRMLVAAMMGTSYANGEQRQDRWQMVMGALGALVELVRHESLQLRVPR